jgi:CRP-like cAMP-binding protein
VSSLQPPLQRYIDSLNRLSPLAAEARAALSNLTLRIVRVQEGFDLVREGDKPAESCLVLEGFVCRYKIVAGGQRQILSFHLAGEVPDLHSLHLERMDHSIAAMAPGRVAYLPHGELIALMHKFPEIADAFWKATLIDGAIFREWIANLGRRTALQRMAHLFCEAFVRMRHAGLTDGQGFQLPLTQASLAEALGLSAVHVNRTLQQLRREGLIESRGRFQTILDWDRLRRIGDFDATYLHLGKSGDHEA